MVDILKIYFHVKAELENIPALKKFPYHGWLHTKSFYDAVCYIAVLENVGADVLSKLKVASLYHDRGYTTGIEEEHEYKSTDICRQELPLFGFSDTDTYDVCRLIMSTAVGYKSVSIPEKIMRDADLEYIGRDYYPYVAELLRMEKGNIHHSVWKVEQIAFLEKHKFLTNSAQLLFDKQKEINYRMLLNS
jgi:uncharacterized protein